MKWVENDICPIVIPIIPGEVYFVRGYAVEDNGVLVDESERRRRGLMTALMFRVGQYAWDYHNERQRDSEDPEP